MLSKKLATMLLSVGVLSGVSGLSAKESTTVNRVGLVNFTTCLKESDFGKKEQENFNQIKIKMETAVKDIEAQMTDTMKKLQDADYLDGLNPKAEEDLKVKFQSLQEEMGKYQSQFYQVLQQANMQMIQAISTEINEASSKVASKENIQLIINKDAAFYSIDSLDITKNVITEMNNEFASLEKEEIEKSEK